MSRLTWVLVVGLGLGLAGFIWLKRRAVPPPPVVVAPVEVPRGELNLVEGRLRRTGETQAFTGIMVEFYPGGGQRQSRSEVSNGVLHGVSEGWFTNGVMQVREPFVEGVAHGTRSKWHANGKLQSTAEIVSGKLHGTFRRWDESGALTEQMEMKNGVAHGLSRAWFPSGFLKAEVEMADGKPVKQTFWKEGEKPGEALKGDGGGTVPR